MKFSKHINYVFLISILWLASYLQALAVIRNPEAIIKGFVILGNKAYLEESGIDDAEGFINKEGLVSVGADELPDLYYLSLRLSLHLERPASETAMSTALAQVKDHFSELKDLDKRIEIPDQFIKNGLVQIVVSDDSTFANTSHSEPASRILSSSAMEVITSSIPSVSGEMPVIKGVVLLGSPDLLNKGKGRTGAILGSSGVEEIPDRETLVETIQECIGRPVNMEELTELKTLIIEHYILSDRELVKVILPEQDVKNGIVEFLVGEGEIKDVKIEGQKHYSESQIRSSLNLKNNKKLDPEEIKDDLRHMNRNPFFNAELVLKPGEEFGETDATLKVNDRRKVRVFSAVDNFGNKLIGENRLQAGINWAPSIPHLINYQYTAGFNVDQLQSHSLSYKYNLPWHHIFSLATGYSIIKSEFDNPILGQEGNNLSVGMYYTIPLKSFNQLEHKLKVGIDYKQSNSSLLFNSISIGGSQVDVFQFVGSYQGKLGDTYGVTSLTLSSYGAPGGWTHKSAQRYYTEASLGNNTYLAARLNLTRKTKLPWDLTWVSRVVTHLASTNLPPSEQMGAGGNASVRGYEEREANGDKGVLITNELRSNVYKIADLFHIKGNMGDLQFLSFFDYAGLRTHTPGLNSVNPTIDLLSTGLGFRYTFGQYVALNFDYGWQLKDSGTSTLSRKGDNSRGHLYFNASY